MNQKNKYFPMLAGFTALDLLGEKSMLIWDKFYTLPQKTQDLLLSDKIAEFIFGVEQRYHLQDAQTEEFSRTIRKYFFREITKDDFAQKISALCRISLDQALKLLQAISVINPINNDKKSVNYVKLSFNDAIKKHPEILKQIITGKSIVTKPFLKPLKPTVKNWIMVYEKILDVSKHNTIERGEFVFRSQATQGLNEDERKKLLTLFKSRDEDSKLTIDINSGKIVFDTGENIQKQTTKSIPSKNIKKQVVSEQNTQIQSTKKQNNINLRKNNNLSDLSTQQINTATTANSMDMSMNSQSQKSQDVNNQIVDEISDTQQVDKQLPIDVQKEILKNKKEMNKGFNNINKPKKNKPKKIGSAVFDTNINKIEEQIEVPQENTVTTQASEINKSEVVEKIPQEKVEEKGKISFSSNHVLPAEKTKKILKKQNQQQQNQYNAFNMKPIGQIHNITKNSDTKNKDKK